MIYYVEDDVLTLTLTRTGMHSDLFKLETAFQHLLAGNPSTWRTQHAYRKKQHHYENST